MESQSSIAQQQVLTWIGPDFHESGPTVLTRRVLYATGCSDPYGMKMLEVNDSRKSMPLFAVILLLLMSMTPFAAGKAVDSNEAPTIFVEGLPLFIRQL